MERLNRVLLHLNDFRRVAIDPARIYLLRADGDDTLVRARGARPYRDVRRLSAVSAAFEPHGFLRVHHDHAVNLLHVRELRRRGSGDDWELKLQPPVGRVLPISRDRLRKLLAAFGDRP